MWKVKGRSVEGRLVFCVGRLGPGYAMVRLEVWGPFCRLL